MPGPIRLVVITGMSGSGKTHVLHLFEDRGYFCVDNLPAALIPTFVTLIQSAGSPHRNVAICIDARAGQAIASLSELLDDLDAQNLRVETLYLETDDETLIRRYSESRRPHPAARDGAIADGIAHERTLLGAMRQDADVVIDTSHLSMAELRERVDAIAMEGVPGSEMRVSVMSFGDKNGVPKEADLVFDARFLANPHYLPELRDKDGRDAPVRDYVFDDPHAARFLDLLLTLLDFLIPLYAAEPKAYLTLAIGCTGGRHRSVALAEALATRLRNAGTETHTLHRDLPPAPRN